MDHAAESADYYATVSEYKPIDVHDGAAYGTTKHAARSDDEVDGRKRSEFFKKFKWFVFASQKRKYKRITQM